MLVGIIVMRIGLMRAVSRYEALTGDSAEACKRPAAFVNLILRQRNNRQGSYTHEHT